MQLREKYDVERSKWDAIVPAETPAKMAAPAASFEDYAERNPLFAGVTEFLGPLAGKTVLDSGCGLGFLAILAAKSGASVSAFDISPARIEFVRKRAALTGVADRVDAIVAVGEDLPYPDESFDIAVGKGVLHHLEPELAAPELRRVLRTGGKAVFVEPMGMNPLLNFARDHLPYPGKHPHGADRPVTYDDIDRWAEGFSTVECREQQLLSMVERVFGMRKRFPALRRVDDALLSRYPVLRRYCRYVTIFLEN